MTNDNQQRDAAVTLDGSADQFAKFGQGSIAYIRSVQAGDIAETVPQVRELPPATLLYALHGASGDPILLTRTREMALAGAQEHDLTPVSVH